ncbi:AAA family ATPase [Saccharothrix deserti]|uniref:AAA family ATPase n=1 Tax=Saccharothrix deserti TaxID=2593674 RepID=UPI00131B9B7D|nr:LuxR family transcriptional regulator [Saccharothrix deserti]
MLFEREDELGVVSRALRMAAEGAGSVVVIGGPLGNGKSALLHALGTLPEADGFHVLRATASPFERGFAGGVVRQLLEPVLAGVDADVWRGPAALARPVFCANGVDSALGTVDVQQAVRFGAQSLAHNVVGDAPALVLVDDLQWADELSARLLVDLADCVATRRVVFVAAVREGDPLTDRPEISAVVAAAAHQLRPRFLSPAGSLALMRERLGPACDEEFGLACHEATDGNPMFLTALALDWALGDQAPVAAHADVVRTLRPGRSRDRLLSSLRAQPEPVRALAEALAVLADCGDPSIAGVLADLDETTTAEALGVLRTLGLVAGDGFAHPGVRHAVEEMMSTAEREDAQLRAARLLHDRGWPAEQVATLLIDITAPQGDWVVGTLRVAADNAARGGANEVAARYLRRALLETSVDGEDRAKVLVDLATVERGFDIHAAVRHIRYATALLARPRDRAAAAIRLAPTVMGDAPEPVAAMLRRIGDELGDPDRLEGVDRDLALRVEARLRHLGETDRYELAETLTRLAKLGAGPPLATGADRELLTVLLHGAMLTARRPAAELARLAEEVLAREPATPAHVHTATPLLVSVLAAADSPGVITGWLDEAYEAARVRGDAVEQAMIRTEQSLAYLMSGRLTEASAAAADAYGMGALDWNTASRTTAVVSGAVALQLRDPVLTDRLLAAVDDQPDSVCLAAVVGLLRGSAAVMRGDLAGAATAVLACGAQLDQSGWRNPVLFPWRTSVALIKHALGESDTAFALAEEERLIAHEWGAPAGIGRAWRVLGRLSAERHGVELSQRAVEVLEGSANRLELAKALRQSAEMSGRGDVWRRCLEVAVECGSTSIADRARQALGGQAPSGPRLTPSERKVAALAAGGRSNQEIADELSVTSRAVEKHLTNTYRKLGVRGRADLADVLHHVNSR